MAGLALVTTLTLLALAMAMFIVRPAGYRRIVITLVVAAVSITALAMAVAIQWGNTMRRMEQFRQANSTQPATQPASQPAAD